jgi:fatty-acyl-CoA synthase
MANRRYTYAQLNRRTLALTYALKHQLSIRRGDVVAIIAPNIPAMLEAHFAIPAANAIICAINTRLAPKEVDYILNHSGAKVVLVDAEFAGLVQGSKLPKVVIADTGVAATDEYERFLETGYREADSLGWGGLDQTDDENEGVSLCYTRFVALFMAGNLHPLRPSLLFFFFSASYLFMNIPTSI